MNSELSTVDRCSKSSAIRWRSSFFSIICATWSERDDRLPARLWEQRRLCEERAAAYQKSFSRVQIFEVLVDQVGVFVQQVGVQRLHDEDDGLCVQLRAQKLGECLWVGGGQQIGASRCVPAGAGGRQSLAKLVGVSWMEVDAGVVVFAAAIRIETAGRFLTVLNLRTTEVMLEQCLGLKAGNGTDRQHVCVKSVSTALPAKVWLMKLFYPVMKPA